MPKTAPHVLLVPEWVERFKAAASRAEHSIYVQSLNFESGTLVDSLVPILISAAKRGVKVVLHIDWVAQFYVHGTIKLLPRTKHSDLQYAEEIWKKNQAHVEALRAAGCTFRYTNRFTWWQQFLKISGRNHQKIYIVDEKIAWMGGVNLLDASLRSLDVMLEFEDRTTVLWLLSAFRGVDELRPEADYQVDLNEQSHLLVDAGYRGSSIIYDHTLELVEQATKSIFLISQFVPEGRLRQALLNKARAGVPVMFLTSPVMDRKFRTWPYQPVYKKFVWDVRGVANFTWLHLPQHVHAKVILLDQQQVLVGSHNLVETGISLGTQEVAYCSSHPQLVGWFSRWFETLSTKN